MQQNAAVMAPHVDRCSDCERADRPPCANHRACKSQHDARLAADVGIGWAMFVRGQIPTIRKPWPDFTGRCAEIALWLVEWLSDSAARRAELARICWWRAGMRWDALHHRIRDRPGEFPTGRDQTHDLLGHSLVKIHFRTRRASQRMSPWQTATPKKARR